MLIRLLFCKSIRAAHYYDYDTGSEKLNENIVVKYIFCVLLCSTTSMKKYENFSMIDMTKKNIFQGICMSFYAALLRPHSKLLLQFFLPTTEKIACSKDM